MQCEGFAALVRHGDQLLVLPLSGRPLVVDPAVQLPAGLTPVSVFPELVASATMGPHVRPIAPVYQHPTLPTQDGERNDSHAARDSDSDSDSDFGSDSDGISEVTSDSEAEEEDGNGEQDANTGASETESDTDEDEQEPTKYVIDRLLSKHWIRGRVYYQVAWRGGDVTTEPRTNLMKDVPLLVRRFERQLSRRG